MIWLTWRQFRAQTWTALGALAAAVTAFAVTRPQLAHLFTSSGLARCTAAGGGDCAAAQSTFFTAAKGDGYPVLFFVGVVLLYLAPAVIGMFWGAPLVARELEAGTFRLTWSQGVTRPRWLAVKLALVGLTALLTSGLLSLTVTWWSGPIDRADGLPGQPAGSGLPNRFMPVVFGARDLAPVGYAVFGFVLGVVVGVLVRRTVPAMAVTLAVFTAVQVLVPVTVRAEYRAPAHTTTPLVMSATAPAEIRIGQDDSLGLTVPVNLPGAWVTGTAVLDPAGQPFHGAAPQPCLDMTGSPVDCYAAINALRLRQLVTYQPAGRYWGFQWTETGLYLLLSLGLAGFCVQRVRRLRLA